MIFSSVELAFAEMRLSANLPVRLLVFIPLANDSTLLTVTVSLSFDYVSAELSIRI